MIIIIKICQKNYLHYWMFLIGKKIFYGLSLIIGGSKDTYVQGLKDVPVSERPPIKMTFFSFHAMVALGGYFLFITFLGVFLYWRKKLFDNQLFLKILMYSVPLPIVANEVGWIAAEVGRQPWIVQGMLKTKDAISRSVPAEQILISLILFAFIYLIIFIAWIYLLKHKINQGPQGVTE